MARDHVVHVQHRDHQQAGAGQREAEADQLACLLAVETGAWPQVDEPEQQDRGHAIAEQPADGQTPRAETEQRQADRDTRRQRQVREVNHQTGALAELAVDQLGGGRGGAVDQYRTAQQADDAGSAGRTELLREFGGAEPAEHEQHAAADHRDRGDRRRDVPRIARPAHQRQADAEFVDRQQRHQRDQRDRVGAEVGRCQNVRQQNAGEHRADTPDGGVQEADAQCLADLAIRRVRLISGLDVRLVGGVVVDCRHRGRRSAVVRRRECITMRGGVHSKMRKGVRFCPVTVPHSRQRSPGHWC